MFGKKTLIFITLLVCAISYLGYIEYPDGCDYPIGIKLYYSATKFVTTLADFAEILGANYLTVIRSAERDFSQDVEGITLSEHKFGGVKTTIIRPLNYAERGEGSVIIYYHGGGWSIGGIVLYAPYMKKLAKESGMMVIVPEYRLAPEYPYPIPFYDCLHATLGFVKRAKEFDVNPEMIVLAGDSAGGNLATAIALHLKRSKIKEINPCMLSVVYPVLQMSNFLLPSYQQNRNPPLLTPPIMAHFFLLYMGMEHDKGLITPMVHNLHVNRIKNKNLMERTSTAWVTEKYKQRKFEKPGRNSTNKERNLLEKYEKKLQEFASDIKFAPLSASDDDLKLLPRTHILTCEYDILRDDGVILYERMKALGLEVSHQNLEFGAHGLLSMYGVIQYDKLDNAVAFMIEKIKEGLNQCYH